jgi:anaerobic ribonucleoside-triphosphate reductase activating protein
VVPVAELSRRIGRVDGIEGVSVLGGEPLQQRLAVMELLTLIRAETPLSIILWSGFTLEEISRMPEAERLFGLIDVLIAGRYEHEKRLARGLRGSTNKTVTFFSGRYTRADIDSVPECEIIFTEDGEVLVTGIDPIISTSE